MRHLLYELSPIYYNTFSYLFNQTVIVGKVITKRTLEDSSLVPSPRAIRVETVFRELSGVYNRKTRMSESITHK